jgi:hypothetical protein
MSTPAGEPDPRRLLFRAALLLLPLVAGALALPHLLPRLRGGAPAEQPRPPAEPSPLDVAAAAWAERKVSEHEKRWGQAEVLAPGATRAGADGEVTSRFQGFGLSVSTVPDGARVLVDGRDVGEAPVVASVDCEPGAPVEVVVEKAGHRRVHRPTTCRADTLVELTVPLPPR